MDQTGETLEITKSETERINLDPNTVNPTMYSTVDAKAPNTKGSWNDELMRPVKTGSRARAKLPELRKIISVTNSRQATKANQKAISLYQRKQTNDLPDSRIISTSKKGRSKSKKNDKGSLKRKY